MAKLYISEYANLASYQGTSNSVQAAGEPASAVQVVDFSGGAASSAAFGAQTRFVRLNTDATCSVRFDGQAATTSYPRMGADQTEYFGVQPGSKLSVIGNS